MKIIALSDSHGRKSKLEQLLKSSNYDYVFYLGDGLGDISNFDEPNIIKVCGNCDFFSTEAKTRIENFGLVKSMLTHGHLFKAKYAIEPMISYAKDNNCSLLCFGHTHKQKYEIVDNLTVVNPGAFKNGNYALINIDEKGNINVELKSI